MAEKEQKHDALVGRHCRDCAMWHNPAGTPVGFCVAHPPTAFIVGMAPAPGAVLVDPKRPPPMQPMVDSKVPVCGGDDGCWEHVSRASIKLQ